MANHKGPWFVYAISPIGPHAQVWWVPQVDSQGKEQPTYAKHEISQGEASLGIDALKGKYPYVSKSE